MHKTSHTFAYEYLTPNHLLFRNRKIYHDLCFLTGGRDDFWNDLTKKYYDLRSSGRNSRRIAPDPCHFAPLQVLLSLAVTNQ